jgi:ATP-binding cassette subfamily B protein
MENGVIVEQGTHSMLLPAGGLYSQLWKKQAGFTWHDSDNGVDIDIARLRHVPILAGLKPSLLTELRSCFQTEHFPAGRVIVHEGDPGDRFYILVRGTAIVTKAHADGDNPVSLGVLQDGDFFGEIALLKDMLRTATVRAKRPCACISVERESFASILSRFPQIRDEVISVAEARFTQLGSTC